MKAEMYIYIIDVLNYDESMLEQIAGKEHTIPEAVRIEAGVNIDFYTIGSIYSTNIVYLNSNYSALILYLEEGEPSKEAKIDGIGWECSFDVNTDAFAFIKGVYIEL